MTAPWTPRERQLRAALEEVAGGLHAYCNEHDEACCRICLDEEISSALSEPPPPDPRDEALRLAEEALKKAKCRCTKALDNTCPTCGETLIAVRYSGYLNEDQWDAIKGGDWYCNTCTDPSIVNGKKHWHDRELQTVTYQTCFCCDALAAIAAAKGEG